MVEAKGADEAFTIADAKSAGGRREQTWHYPSRAECMMCHSRAATYVLGVSTAQLNCEFDYPGGRDNQLRTLSHLGLFNITPANELREAVVAAGLERGLTPQAAEAVFTKLPRGNQRTTPAQTTIDPGFDLLPWMADPTDERASLEARARSYLHVNCAHCHVGAGGGNSQFEIAHWTPTRDAKLLDIAPLHAKFDLREPLLVARGEPERSVLWHRMTIRGRGQMPPLASSLVDPVGIDVVRRWIAALPRRREPTMVEP